MPVRPTGFPGIIWLKKGQVLWIYRIALTGAAATPGGGAEMVKLFGKAEALKRLEKVKSAL